MSLKLSLCFAAALIMLAGCAERGPASPGDQTKDQETREMQPVVDRYKSQSVMGFDIKGTTLMLNVDAEQWSELDEPAEIALRNAVLDAWARAWAKHHGGQHATVRLRVQNYYGQEITAQSKSV
ncbi:MAG: hypothetical protein JOZ59_03380 [Candidatus Eremiobacteraeota bacterium]|nr:hypothetical protein [Candidatus Eremiobacteraeota bacterium]